MAFALSDDSVEVYALGQIYRAGECLHATSGISPRHGYSSMPYQPSGMVKHLQPGGLQSLRHFELYSR